MAKKQSIGFGFMPEEAKQHFLVVVPRNNQNEDIAIYERFFWDEDTQAGMIADKFVPTDREAEKKITRLKILLRPTHWSLVKVELEAELNRILKQENKRVGHFKAGQNLVERLLGKEMLVLLWAIEDCDPSVIPNAVKNWLGLSREERWWLFTMTNAATGNAEEKRGWRKALRYALTENPVIDKKKEMSFESLEQWA